MAIPPTWKNSLRFIGVPPKAGPPRNTHLYFTANQKLAAIRQGDWKLFLAAPMSNGRTKKNKEANEAKSETAATGAVLYNLASDPSEAKDVAAEHPEIVAKLQAEAARREAEIKEHRRPDGQLSSTK